MIISRDGSIKINTELSSDSAIQQHSYKNFDCYYHGLIFCRGLRSGKESIQFILDEFIDSGYIPFNKIHGAFLLTIKNRNSDEQIFFTDNSNLRSFYLGKTTISNDFLELIHEENTLTFDIKFIIEYLSLGTIYFGNTLLSEITLSDSEHYYTVTNENFCSKSKDINSLDSTASQVDFHDFFQDLVFAIYDERISIDLTGGYDSRLIFSEIKKHVPDIDICISGFKDSEDVIVASIIAKIVGMNIDVYTPARTVIDEEYLWELFDHSQTFSSLTNSIRISGFMRERQNRGYNIRLTGDGGVLHKDWWWIQDFPFYNKKHTDLDRFFHQRIYLTRIKDNILTVNSRKTIAKIKNDFIARIRKYSRNTNTQTYDMLYYYVSGSKLSPSYNSVSKYLTTYAPLWELDLARASYQLPRKKRFYANYIRDLITESAPEISRVRTVYGMNASSRRLDKIADSIYFLKDIFDKARRVYNRKFFNKNIVSDVDISNPYNDIRALDIFHDAVSYFKELDILRPDVVATDINDSMADRILSVYMLYIYSGRKITYGNQN